MASMDFAFNACGAAQGLADPGVPSELEIPVVTGAVVVALFSHTLLCTGHYCFFGGPITSI